MTTFAEVLAAQLRRDPGRPLVTFYDHATDERVELSVTTYANWVAKASGLLTDVADLERGMSLRIDLPAALALAGVPRRGLDRRPAGHDLRRAGRRRVRARRPRRLGPRASQPAGARLQPAPARRTFRRAAAAGGAGRRGRDLGPARRLRRVGPAHR